jgi:MYXO-CTERM domain-containing protein
MKSHRSRALGLGASIGCVIAACALLASPRERSDTARGVTASGAEGSAWKSLPLGTRIGIERAMAEGDAACAPEVDGDAVHLRSPSGPSVRLVAGGAELPMGAHRMKLRAHAVGRAEHRTRLEASSAPSVEGHEARMDRGHGVVEWWRALRRGLEHGVTLAARPEGEGDVVVELDLGGSLTPELRGEAIALVDGEGRAIARYGEMFVADARGQELASRFEVDGRRVRIWFEDAGAEYPVVVDPMVFGEEQKLLASDKANNDYFGTSVAMSGDGSRVVVGAPEESDATGGSTWKNGAAYVFVRSGGTWSEEQKLLASDKASEDSFGRSVSMSGDGSRVVVGAPYESDATGGSTEYNGAAYVFVRSGSTWTQEQKLLASDKASYDEFGRSVAMSGDGSRVVVGAPEESDATGGSTEYNGAAYVFVRSGSTWTEEQKLLASDKADTDLFGYSVGMSGDGSRVVVGAYGEDTSTTDNGAAYVFIRSGSTWSEEKKLLASDKADTDLFGYSVGMSADGSRVVVGAHYESDATGGSTEYNGAAYVFVRSGSTWSEEQKLLASDKASGDIFGMSVAMSADGSRVVIGAHNESDATGGSTTTNGAAYVFVRDDSTWSEEKKLIASDKADHDRFGWAVAMSGDGSRVVVGAYGEDDATGTSTTANGAAYVFALGANGLPCSLATECSSGFCIEGFCCETACGDGATDDCQSCTQALTGVKNGTCAPLSLAVAGLVTCRPSVGACDIAETCVAGVSSCPPDIVVAANVECREALGACDVAEFCTGTSGSCPANEFVANGTTCDDGLVCSQTSSCQLGICAPSVVLDCSDGDPCTIDSCEEPSGCVHTPVADCSGEMDAGVDGGDTDGGDTEPRARGGCSCSVNAAGTDSPAPNALLTLVLLVFFGMRRVRRSRTTAARRHG